MASAIDEMEPLNIILGFVPSSFVSVSFYKDYIHLTTSDNLNHSEGLDRFREREEVREAGGFSRFLKAVLSSCRELSVHGGPCFCSNQELSALFNGIASSSTLISLKVYDKIKPQDEADTTHVFSDLLGEALCRNASVRCLSLCPHLMDMEKHLLPALTWDNPPLHELHVNLTSHDTLDCLQPIFLALAHNTVSKPLTKLCVQRGDTYRTEQATNYRCGETLGTMLSTNTTLTELQLRGLYLPGTFVRSLFESLHSNSHLKKLSLYGCKGQDWPSASVVLDCLRYGVLHDLDLTDTPLEFDKEPAVRAQLERNRDIGKQSEVLKSTNEKKVQPTAARLFLCGFPHAGKTTLASSLQNNSFARRYLSRAACCIFPRQRTFGIEVTTIKKGKLKVSLWDLAGQDQYHAFHDHMFPNFGSEATPSLFLFVWNPIVLNEATGHEERRPNGKIELKTLAVFENEFRYWLKFIASKVVTSSKFKPMLLVAVTRADRLQTRPVHLSKGHVKDWLRDVINRCKEEFKEYIQFDIQTCFEMDARNPKQVKSLAHHIFQCAQTVLGSMPPVYPACDHARRVITGFVHRKLFDPIVTKEEFHKILERHAGLLDREIQEAVALSLNDSGDLIYFPSSNLVVLNMQWFCHHIMGNLLHVVDDDFASGDGSFSVQVLSDLLENTARAKVSKFYRFKFNRKPTKIKGEILIELLQELRLAYQEDNSSKIFVPGSWRFSKKKTPIQLGQYSEDAGNFKTCMGRRLKCKDSIQTFFTPGIFPLLQVTFRKTLKEVNIVVDLQVNIIAFARDGVNVFVEFCEVRGRDHFIDILVHSGKNLNDTIEWVNEEVITKIERVCSQPKGIQGVELIYEVINPSCVENIMHGAEDRIEQAASMEELRGTLERYLETKKFDPEQLNEVLYTWQATKGISCVTTLLGDVETWRIVESYQRKLIIDLEDALGDSMEEEVCSSSEQAEIIEFSSCTAGRELKILYDEIKESRKDIKVVHEDIKKMHNDLQNKLSTLCHAAVPKLQAKMDQILLFANEGEAGTLPRLFVFTKSDGLGRKIIAAMVPGLRNVRLELLCEHQKGPHLVDNKRGLTFSTLEDGLLKRGLPYFSEFLTILRVAAKVGVQVATTATGLGPTAPIFNSLIDCTELKPCTIDLPPESRTNFQGRQRWLSGVLFQKNCSERAQIHEVFGLSPVRCHDLRVRWLCDEHCHEGRPCPI